MSQTTTDKAPPEWPYWMPMAVFMAFIFGAQLVGGPMAFAAAYVGRSVVCGAICVWMRKYWEKIVWSHTPLAILVGIVGTVQWVGMELGLMYLVPSGFNLGPVQLISDITDQRDYVAEFGSYWWFYPFLAVRFLGPVLVVPVVEEQFWRNWLWRSISSPNDIRLARIGERDPTAILVVAIAFAAVHVQFITAVVWALLIAWPARPYQEHRGLHRAHAVTNFCLGIWILCTWKFFGDWVPFDRPHWFFW